MIYNSDFMKRHEVLDLGYKSPTFPNQQYFCRVFCCVPSGERWWWFAYLVADAALMLVVVGFSSLWARNHDSPRFLCVCIVQKASREFEIWFCRTEHHLIASNVYKFVCMYTVYMIIYTIIYYLYINIYTVHLQRCKGVSCHFLKYRRLDAFIRSTLDSPGFKKPLCFGVAKWWRLTESIARFGFSALQLFMSEYDMYNFMMLHVINI